MVGLDNFRSPDVEVVYIEAGIYHGGELLVGEKSTSEVSSTTYPRWNQWLVFDIAVKNLPKVGKLLRRLIRSHKTDHWLLHDSSTTVSYSS